MCTCRDPFDPCAHCARRIDAAEHEREHGGEWSPATLDEAA